LELGLADVQVLVEGLLEGLRVVEGVLVGKRNQYDEGEEQVADGSLLVGGG